MITARRVHMMARWTQDTKAEQQRTRKLWVLPSCAIRCLVLSHVKVRFVSWSWESVGGHIWVNYDSLRSVFLVQTAGLFNIGLADGIPPDQMFASWGPTVGCVYLHTSSSAAFLSPFLWVTYPIFWLLWTIVFPIISYLDENST